MPLIESKLPRSIVLEWYRRLHTKGAGIGRDNKFQRLLEYLQVEKNALEHSLSDVRNSPDRFTRERGYQSNQFEETLYCFGFMTQIIIMWILVEIFFPKQMKNE